MITYPTGNHHNSERKLFVKPFNEDGKYAKRRGKDDGQ